MDIGELPEDIIHHILALIPGGVSTKQLARLSLISKGWLHACPSYWVIDICHTCSYVTRKTASESDGFIRWVDKTITRFRDDNRTMHELKLHLGFKLGRHISDCLDDQVTNALDNWINCALDNRVEELDLRVKVSGGRVNSSSTSSCSSGYYTIPTRVMSSSVLKSLFLGHQVCLPSNMDESSICRRLGSLEIFQVPDINSNDVFQRLIKACPCLETLIIESQYLKDINISGLNHIKTLNVTRITTPPSFLRLKLDAPSLETLILTGTVHSYKNIDCCNVKYMKLRRDIGLFRDEEMFSRFPMLETLEFYNCVVKKLILCSNLMLKKVKLNFPKPFYMGWRMFVLCCPKLETQFKCEVASPKSLGSMCLGNGPRYFEMVFKCAHPVHIFPRRFLMLRDAMRYNASVDNYRSLSCKFTWESESGEEKVMLPVYYPACEIDHLTLAVDAPSRSYPVILTRFFTIVHPTTLHACLIDDGSTNGKGREFLKFLCESIIGNKENNNDYEYTGYKHPTKFWKYQLIEVKIECIKESRGNMHYYSHCDRDTIFTQLPTLTVDQHICFRLKWAQPTYIHQ